MSRGRRTHLGSGARTKPTEVADQHTVRAEVLIRMPDARGDVHQSPVVRGAEELADELVRRRVLSDIAQDDLGLTLDDEEAVLVISMQAVALRDPRASREQVNEDEGIKMPARAWVEHLTNRSAIVDAGRRLMEYQAVWKWLEALTGHRSMNVRLGFA